MSVASSRNGAISIRSATAGLPIAVTIENSEVRRLSPSDLAKEIMKLNRLATMRAQNQLRKNLEEENPRLWDRDSLNRLGYPTNEQLAREEAILGLEEDEMPDTWLRKV